MLTHTFTSWMWPFSLSLHAMLLRPAILLEQVKEANPSGEDPSRTKYARR